MQVARWGNSLAVRIPVELAMHLNLSEGKLLSLRTKANLANAAPVGGLAVEQAPFVIDAAATSSGVTYTATVGKWGNSLGVRLPRALVKGLGVREGDDLRFDEGETGMIEIKKEMTAADGLAALRALRGMIPAGYKFDREEANSREPNAEDR